ncbi:MAG: GNAT family N-acetyltransferase [Acetobacteraceae bacterium]|nr:GNAT family N-acetyltransferase [Acetobacteraceae bacterium]
MTREPSAGVVLLEVERIRDRRGFLSALRSLSRSRPVVAIRTTAEPRESGNDVPADQVFAAALRRAGALCVDGLEDMFAAVAALPRVRALRGERIAVISRSRALARLTERALARHGLALAPPPRETVPALSTLLPPAQAAENPFVLPPGTPPTRMAELAAALAQLDGADAAIVVHVPERTEASATVSAVAESLATVARLPRRLPLLAVWPGETASGVDRARLDRAGIPSFPTPEEAAAAAALLVEHRRAREAARELPPRRVLGIEPDRAAVEALFAAVRAAGRTTLMEDEALHVLAAYGLPVVPTRVAPDPAAAAEAAGALGFPVVLKIRSPDLPRKTEAGGVALDLADCASVRRAAEEMLVRVGAAAPDARLEGFVLQRQVRLRGRQELAVRVGRDSLFGPAILFGAGGTKASVIGDVAAALPPLNLVLARDLVLRTRISRVLQGLRDQPPADLEALAAALVRVSQLVVDRPDLVALDINPLLAGPDGAIAVDAGATISAEPAVGTAHLAIAPYPAEFEEVVRLKDGRAVLIRPIRPEDAEAHLDFFRRLSPEDVRLRFFAPVSSLSPELVVRLTQIDYDREMAFIGVGEGAEGEAATLGVVRIVREPGGDEGEFAVIVRSDLKRLGLGSLLMRKAIAWAKAAGLAAIAGEVLAENRAMLAFVERLGFALQMHPQDPELRIARLPLR